MVGNNPEVQKRKAIQSALKPSYASDSTESPQVSFEYTFVPAVNENKIIANQNESHGYSITIDETKKNK